MFPSLLTVHGLIQEGLVHFQFWVAEQCNVSGWRHAYERTLGSPAIRAISVAGNIRTLFLSGDFTFYFLAPDWKGTAFRSCLRHLKWFSSFCVFKAPQPTIRANTIVAVGDLTFRFPNLIEPWTSHLYARFVCYYNRRVQPKPLAVHEQRTGPNLTLLFLVFHDKAFLVPVKGLMRDLSV